MTEVPFTPVGPGQSARLVYQVMGGNGPIANPRGIRFMDPGSVGAGSLAGGGGVPGLFSAVGAVQILDLGIGIANLGVGLATLQTVRSIERKVDTLWFEVEYQTSQLQALSRRLQRVDINVAEQNLRGSLQYLLPRATMSDGFDFDAIGSLSHDLDKFTESFEPWGYGLAPKLRLSTDVRASLNGIWHLLYGTQLSLIAGHNRAVGGDPERCKRHPMDDFMVTILGRLPVTVIDRLHIVRAFRGAGDELGGLVCADFMFAGENQRQNYSNWLHSRLTMDVEAILGATDPHSLALAELIDPAIEEITTDADVETAQTWLMQYLLAWCMSDAGLVFRLQCALEVNADADFWGALEADELEGIFAVDVDAVTVS